MSAPHRLIIVYRDHIAILGALLRYPDRWPSGSAVMLDRRIRDRRTRIQPVAMERRDGERRAAADATWLTQGFSVVQVDHLPAQPIRLDGATAMADRPA